MIVSPSRQGVKAGHSAPIYPERPAVSPAPPLTCHRVSRRAVGQRRQWGSHRRAYPPARLPRHLAHAAQARAGLVPRRRPRHRAMPSSDSVSLPAARSCAGPAGRHRPVCRSGAGRPGPGAPDPPRRRRLGLLPAGAHRDGHAAGPWLPRPVGRPSASPGSGTLRSLAVSAKHFQDQPLDGEGSNAAGRPQLVRDPPGECCRHDVALVADLAEPPSKRPGQLQPGRVWLDRQDVSAGPGRSGHGSVTSPEQAGRWV